MVCYGISGVVNCSRCYLSLQCFLLNFVLVDCRITNGCHQKIVKLLFLRKKGCTPVFSLVTEYFANQSALHSWCYFPGKLPIIILRQVYPTVYTVLCRAQCFLDQCHKRRYISKSVNIYDLLKTQDRKNSTR